MGAEEYWTGSLKKQVKVFDLMPYENILTGLHTKNSSRSNFYLLSNLNISPQCYLPIDFKRWYGLTKYM